MKTNKIIYTLSNQKASGINITSLLSWITVILITILFWSGIATVYKQDYIPHAIAKIEHKEKRFLATHKALQKKLTVIRSIV